MLKHIAFIMDGNGRWAHARLLPRDAGHRAGVKALQKISESCFKRGINVVSLYAFSTENRDRPASEVKKLFSLLSRYLKSETPKMLKNGVRLNIMGDLDGLPDALVLEIKNALAQTSGCKPYVLNIGFNYGGRQEIVRAAIKLVAEGRNITEQSLEDALDTAGLPPPDLIVRTGGQLRLSNFMLYQAAYSELYFCDCLWPDFDEGELDKALADFETRVRNFGKLKKETADARRQQ